MTTQIPTLYLILAAVIGIFIGLLLASLFATRDTHPKQEPPTELVREGFGEVARLWYSPAGKKILLEMEGGHYKEFKTLSKEQQAKALRLAALLNAWTGEPEKSTLEPKAGEVKQSYVPIVPDKRQEPEEPYVPVQREPQYTYELQENEPGVALEEPVKPFLSEDQEEADLVSVLQSDLEDEEQDFMPEVTSTTANLSITQQIGAILDEMVQGSELEDKEIKLIESAENGVEVWVGAEKFSGIESVPYPQVRQVIRDAVLRWEQETELQQRLGE